MPYAVLMACLALSGAATWSVRAHDNAAVERRFEAVTRGARGRITALLESDLALLRAGAVIVAARGRIDQRLFQSYVARAGLLSSHGWLESIGFLAPDGEESRAETSGPCVERACKEAMEAARTSGELRISAPLEGRRFAAVVPVYGASDEPKVVVGFVYGIFRASELVDRVLPNPGAVLRLEDGDEVLHEGSEQRDVPLRTSTRQLVLPGRTWTLRADAPAGFDRALRSRLEVLVGSVSIALSLIVFALALLQVRARARAEEGERKLRESSAERERVEVAHRALAGDFDRLIEHLPDAIIVSTAGRIAYMNRAAAALLGREGGEMIGHATFDIAHPDDLDALRARIEQLQRREVALIEPWEHRWVRAAGDPILVEAMVLPATFAGQASSLLVARDITERKEMQARLMMSDRLASLGSLAAGVAHEINNPLAYTMSNLDFVHSQLQQAGAATELLEGMAEARGGAERVRQIVKDLRVFSRPDDGGKRLVDVGVALDSAINIALHEIRVRAQLLKEYEEVPLVMASEVRLGQVFLNLLLNAAQAIPEGRPDANRIRVALRSEGQGVVVEVSDTGCGIPIALRDRIFDPFFTTKPVGVGTGLGLSICHRIVGTLGGNISLESDVGRGSTFRVRLPTGGAQIDRAA